MVPEQTSEVPAEREELGPESRRLHRQGDGDRVAVAPHQAVALAARGEQRGGAAVSASSAAAVAATAVDERGNDGRPDDTIPLRRLLEGGGGGDDDAALRGTERDQRLPRLRQRRLGERELAAAVPSPSPSPSSG